MGFSTDHRHHRQRSISSLNPVRCLRPPHDRESTRRLTDHSPPPTTAPNYCPKKTQRRSSSDWSTANDPSSPRIGCMGQIKMDKKAAMTVRGLPRNKFLKLGKMLSERSMAVAAAMSPKYRVKRDEGERIDVADMDPPLPVVKRAVLGDAGGNAVSLWTRRRGGVGWSPALTSSSYIGSSCDRRRVAV